MNRKIVCLLGTPGSALTIIACLLPLVFTPGCDSVSTRENNVPPSVNIDSKLHRTVYEERDVVISPIVLEGTAQDNNTISRTPEAIFGNNLIWSSNIDAELGRGGRINVYRPSAGPHIITLTATDGYGNTDTDEITIYVNPTGNRLPEPQIDSPEQSMNFYFGNTVLFSGSATDIITEIDDDGVEHISGEREITGENLLWESNLDGDLGWGNEIQTGPEEEKNLSPGIHTITLWAFDDLGIPGVTSINIRILYDETTSPTVRIQYYDSERWWEKEDLRIVEGQSIRLRAVATDPQDGELTGESLRWESSIEGDLGSGVEITTDSLSENENNHIITVTATDSDGNNRSDQIKIRVGPYIVIPVTGSR